MKSGKIKARILSLFLVFALLATCAMPSYAQSDAPLAPRAVNNKVIVIANSVALRSSSSTSSEVLGYYNMGKVFTYIHTGSGWYYVTDGVNNGYISSQYTRLVDIDNAKCLRVTEIFNIRTAPRGTIYTTVSSGYLAFHDSSPQFEWIVYDEVAEIYAEIAYSSGLSGSVYLGKCNTRTPRASDFMKADGITLVNFDASYIFAKDSSGNFIRLTQH